MRKFFVATAVLALLLAVTAFGKAYAEQQALERTDAIERPNGMVLAYPQFNGQPWSTGSSFMGSLHHMYLDDSRFPNQEVVFLHFLVWENPAEPKANLEKTAQDWFMKLLTETYPNKAFQDEVATGEVINTVLGGEYNLSQVKVNVFEMIEQDVESDVEGEEPKTELKAGPSYHAVFSLVETKRAGRWPSWEPARK
ncbi:MAG: hypothetical protein U5N86_07450 [Planctomycetota bacterium]|nr:hypothetical protein [Planctomycetota bacterium]